MTAEALPVRRLRPEGRFGGSWAEFLHWAGDRLVDEHDPWLLFPFSTDGANALPALVQPVVYAVVAADGSCRYVGKSLDVRDRFCGHARVAGRRERWTFVVCAALDVPEGGLDRAEHMASRIMRPVEGHRHPRLR